MRLLIITITTVFFCAKTYKQDDIVGVWNIIDDNEIGTLEFLKNNTFKMNWTIESDILDSLALSGDYLLESDNVLLMRIKDTEEYLIHNIIALTDSSLTILYKKDTIKYKRSNNK